MKSSLGQTVTASSVSHSYLVEQIWKKRTDGVKDWTMRGTKGPKVQGPGGPGYISDPKLMLF